MMSNENKDYESTSPVAETNGKKADLKTKLIFIAVVSILIGGLLFTHYRRTQEAKPATQEETAPSALHLEAPQLSSLQQELKEIKQNVQAQRLPPITREESPEEKLTKMRMVAPSTVYSAGNGSVNASTAAQEASTNAAVLGGNGKGDDNTQFMARVSSSAAPSTQATRLAHPSTTLAQGTMIWATLETRIVSDLPGMVRAITAENIYSEDGSTLLIPRGSRLIGQYTNAIATGQQRVFIVWQRLIRPDFIDIQLNSPGTDTLGAAGLGADAINKHFFEQFGSSILLSIIGAGAANLNVSSDDQFNSASAYREALANSFSETAQNTLKAKGDIAPTLYINQGKPISVFVARDLDFYNQLQSGN